MVRALHPTTIEVTMEEHLTERGDCIIGVGADRVCLGLNEELRKALSTTGSKVTLRILVAGQSFEVRCRGDRRLLLTNAEEIVVRKSDYVDGRTLAVGADYAAVDIPRRIVERLKHQDATGVLEIEVALP
jgi:hypothetical protein